MKSIPVLQIISGFAVEGPLGGIERFGIELSRELMDTSYHPILCGMWDYGTNSEIRWLEQVRAAGVEGFVSAEWNGAHPYYSFLRAWNGVRRYFSDHPDPPHIIHSHCQFGDVLALLLTATLPVRAVLRTVHNEREWGKRPWRRWLLTNLLYPFFFSAELGVSQKVAANLKNRWVAQLLGREARCVYNAIDLDRFENLGQRHLRTLKRQELGLPLDARVVITVGRLTQQKGYDVLLKSFRLVRQRLPDVYCIIVGDGVLSLSLQKQARRLDIADAVIFTGSRTDVEELLTVADLFVSSSLWEGLPTVILESMAANVPVIATKVSGSIELISDGKTGLLVSAGDSKALAQAMVELLQDPERAYQMTKAAKKVVQRFSVAHVVGEYIEIYNHLLSQS